MTFTKLLKTNPFFPIAAGLLAGTVGMWAVTPSHTDSPSITTTRGCTEISREYKLTETVAGRWSEVRDSSMSSHYEMKQKKDPIRDVYEEVVFSCRFDTLRIGHEEP